jgi:ABC-type multidrug transport system ATPase subunit
MFAAYAWTLSFLDELYHGLDLKANYAFHEPTETYTSVKGWLVVTSIQYSTRISIPRLTIQQR